MNNIKLADRNGKDIVKGEFLKLLTPLMGMVPGPYRFEGFKGGEPYISVNGISFKLPEICEETLEKLPWTEWQRSDFYLDRFLSHYYDSKAPDTSIT